MEIIFHDRVGTLVDRRHTWAAAFSAEACNCVSLLEGPGVSNDIGSKTVGHLYYDAVIHRCRVMTSLKVPLIWIFQARSNSV